MSFQPDIAVYSADHQLQLVVEVKAMHGADAQWAARVYHSLLTHQAVPPSPFFLLALPDQLYLWANKNAPAPESTPFQASTRTTLGRYLSEYSQQNDISGLGLELAVRFWLNDLTHGFGDEHDHLVTDSGLLDAIRYGSVHAGALV